ncbi:hypothetical protein HYW74_01345 [Candidatus Pacearchaeota archaeon]|nr:hypothetical protein [Candidatus Pacearchaeota archaeon]
MAKRNIALKNNKSYLKLADKEIAEVERDVDKIEEEVLDIHRKITFLL